MCFFSLFGLIFLVLWGAPRWGNRSLPAEARPQKCLQSFNHMKWARATSRKGLGAWTPSREGQRAGICNHRLLEPAGMESVANGWQCRGLCCQLASAAVASCHNLVPSTCGGLAAAGPSGERWQGERRERGGARRRPWGPSFRSSLL